MHHREVHLRSHAPVGCSRPVDRLSAKPAADLLDLPTRGTAPLDPLRVPENMLMIRHPNIDFRIWDAGSTQLELCLGSSERGGLPADAVMNATLSPRLLRQWGLMVNDAGAWRTKSADLSTSRSIFL